MKKPNDLMSTELLALVEKLLKIHNSLKYLDNVRLHGYWKAVNELLAEYELVEKDE